MVELKTCLECWHGGLVGKGVDGVAIQLLESPFPTPTPTTTTTTSQKASSGDISGTGHGSIKPLVSKRPEKF